MKVTLYSKDNSPKRATIEINISELSIIHNALLHLSEDRTANYVDRRYAKRMIADASYQERET